MKTSKIPSSRMSISKSIRPKISSISNRIITKSTDKSVRFVASNMMETYIYVIISIAFVIYIYIAYKYLDNLKSCACAEGVYVDNVKRTEKFLMLILLLWMIVSIWLTANIKNMTKSGVILFMYISAIFGMILFTSYVYFCYNVYHMQKQFDQGCPCAMKWQRWLIYIQYGLFLADIVLVCLTVILTIIYMASVVVMKK